MKAYRPRKSHGWLILSLIILPMLLAGGFFIYLYLTMSFVFLLVPALVFLVVPLPFLVILFGSRSMRYELYDKKLVIKCRLLKYVVPITSINRITKRDLEIALTAAARFPGLALSTVLYADVGIVKMCATSASKGVILIETDRGVYGITPLDEKAFIADLRSRVRG